MGSSSIISAFARRLEGKVALITGGAGGIGSCTAKFFHQHGAKVSITDIDDDRGHAICKDLGPDSASFIHCDVTNESNVRDAIDKTVARYGKLDVMFNNAGINEVMQTKITDCNEADFEKILRVNVIGVFLGTKHAARVMTPGRSGSIINTASVCSVMGGLGAHAYTSSKHAVLGLTRNTAIELGQFGIRVNCISPYVVPTSMPRKLMNLKDDDPMDHIYSSLKGVSLKPRDVAEAALYLATDDSKYVSGHNLVVDGGFTNFNLGLMLFDH